MSISTGIYTENFVVPKWMFTDKDIIKNYCKDHFSRILKNTVLDGLEYSIVFFPIVQMEISKFLIDGDRVNFSQTLLIQFININDAEIGDILSEKSIVVWADLTTVLLPVNDSHPKRFNKEHAIINDKKIYYWRRDS